MQLCVFCTQQKKKKKKNLQVWFASIEIYSQTNALSDWTWSHNINSHTMLRTGLECKFNLHFIYTNINHVERNLPVWTRHGMNWLWNETSSTLCLINQVEIKFIEPSFIPLPSIKCFKTGDKLVRLKPHSPPRESGPVNAKILFCEYPTHPLCHTPVDFILFFPCSACPVNLKLISYNK